MVVIVVLDFAVAYRNERVGNRVVAAKRVATLIGVALGSKTPLDLQRIHIRSAADERSVLVHLAFEQSLTVDDVPHLLHLRIALHLRKELRYDRDVVFAGTRITEDAGVYARRIFARQHTGAFRVGDLDAHLLETGEEHAVGNERLPCRANELVRHLVGVGSIAAHLCLHILVSVEILGIKHLLAVDFTHLGVVARESHLGFQRENKSQKRACDNHRKQNAEFGSQCVQTCHIALLLIKISVFSLQR